VGPLSGIPALALRSAGRGTGTVGRSGPEVAARGARWTASIGSARRTASNGVPEWDVVGPPMFASSARGAGRGARTVGRSDPGVVARVARRSASIGRDNWDASRGGPEWTRIGPLLGLSALAAWSAGRGTGTFGQSGPGFVARGARWGASIGSARPDASIGRLGDTSRGASISAWRGASVGMQRSA
jgi:hypothetical protein